PAWGTTESPCAARRRMQNFYPRPPRGGRRFPAAVMSVGKFYFYPRPPRGGRRLPSWWQISVQCYFYPRPPRGGRPTRGHRAAFSLPFLSTSPAWGTTVLSCTSCPVLVISIHVPRVGDDTACRST